MSSRAVMTRLNAQTPESLALLLPFVLKTSVAFVRVWGSSGMREQKPGRIPGGAGAGSPRTHRPSAQRLTLPSEGCVTSGKSLHASAPPSPRLNTEGVTAPVSLVLGGLHGHVCWRRDCHRTRTEKRPGGGASRAGFRQAASLRCSFSL